MFSGIIERLGTVVGRDATDDAVVVTLETGFDDLAPGESVAVDGVCLTVTGEAPRGVARFFVSHETVARTTLGGLRPGARVNLERALTLHTRLSGHLVQGHVDARGRMVSATSSGASDDDAVVLVVALPGTLRRYCAQKGSIALNGVSLTINAIADGPFAEAPGVDELRLSFTLIPHSRAHTNLADIAPGGRLNVEIDMIARHVVRLAELGSGSVGAPEAVS